MVEQAKAFVLLLVFAVILEAALPYWLFDAPAGGVLVSVYLAIGAAFFLFALVIERLSARAERTAYEQTIFEIAQRRVNVGPMRVKAIWLMTAVQRLLCWPAFEAGVHQFRIRRHGAVATGRVATNAALVLFPFEVSVSIYLALAAGVATGLAVWIGHPTVYARAFMWILIVGTAAKHVAALLSPLDMQQRLRRALGSVAMNYLILTFADLVSLLLAYNAVINWGRGPILSRASLQTVYNEMHAFKDVLGAWQHLPSNTVGYATAISGLLWLFTLGNSLLKLFSNGRRSVEDHLSIALSLAMVGMNRQAKESLDRADPSTREQFELKGVGLASLGEFADAEPLLQEYLRQLMVGRVPQSVDYTFVELLEPVPVVPNSTDLLGKVIRHASEQPVSDAFVVTAALMARGFDADPRAISRMMESSGLNVRFPLGYVALRWVSDEEREVIGFFDQLPTPSMVVDRAVQKGIAALLLPARHVGQPALEAAISQWLQHDLPAIVADASTSLGLHVLFIAMVLGRVQGYLAHHGMSPEPITAALAGLEPLLASDPVVRKIRVGPPSTPQAVKEMMPPPVTPVSANPAAA